MKKLHSFTNVLIFFSLGLWAIKAFLDYTNYTRHVALFAANGWVWYTDTLAWGKWILPVVVICLIAQLFLRRK